MQVKPTEIRGLGTERRNERTKNIDLLSTKDMVRMLNDENRVLADAVDEQAQQIADAVDIITDRMQRGGRLVYVGAGTSGRLGILDASECPPTFSVPDDRVIGFIAGGREAIWKAAENVEDDDTAAVSELGGIGLGENDVVCGVAASGRTPYVIGALDYAKSVGAARICVCNNKDSTLAKHSEVAIEVAVGPEALTGSTRLKAGTAQKLVLNILTTASMIKQGKTYGNLMVDVKASNKKLHARCVNILKDIFPDESEQRLVDALAEADGSVKLAAVIVKKSCTAAEGQKMLNECGGYLRRIMD